MNLSANTVSDVVMDTAFLTKKFERIGARLKVVDRPSVMSHKYGNLLSHAGVLSSDQGGYDDADCENNYSD
jgi:hypothetical protein